MFFRIYSAELKEVENSGEGIWWLWPVILLGLTKANEGA